MFSLRKISLLILLMGILPAVLIAPSLTHAATYTAIQNGNWNDTATHPLACKDDFGRLRVGESSSVLLYAFPYL